MTLTDLISRNCVAVDLKVSSKKQLIQEMAEIMAACGSANKDKLDVRDIVNAAMERERLGSTGVGSGVALPHARLDGLKKVVAVTVRLDTPVEYEAIDDRPVDLVVLILAPTNAGGDHLKALALFSRKLRNEDVRARLRKAPDAESFYTIFTEEARATAA